MVLHLQLQRRTFSLCVFAPLCLQSECQAISFAFPGACSYEEREFVKHDDLRPDVGHAVLYSDGRDEISKRLRGRRWTCYARADKRNVETEITPGALLDAERLKMCPWKRL